MLIIFDCDGVLVDSEHLAAEVFSDALKTINVNMTTAECYKNFHGKTLVACYRWLHEEKDITIPETFPTYLQQQTKKRFDAELKSVQGIDQVLEFIKRKRIKYCVASNGGHKKMIASLTATGLISHFPHRFSAEDVERGKPYPDLFLYAARQMGCDREKVLVVEDSSAGFQAANAAKMEVVIYAPEPRDDFPAVQVCDTMDCVLKLLQARVS